jgi:hypothetical protein
MTKLKTLMAPATLAIVLAVPAFAQDVAIDVNGDGMYSYAELTAVLPDISEADFGALDVSADGLLDAEEIAAGQEAGLLPS